MKNRITHQPQPESAEPALAYAWGQYQVWANNSRKLKKQLTAWRAAVLTFTILGAISGILSNQLTGEHEPWLGKALAFLSTVAIALATFIGREVLSPGRERQWVIARSTAEACKSECFKFSTGTPPYDESHAWRILLNQIDQLEQTMANMLISTISEEQRQMRPPFKRLIGRGLPEGTRTRPD